MKYVRPREHLRLKTMDFFSPFFLSIDFIWCDVLPVEVTHRPPRKVYICFFFLTSEFFLLSILFSEENASEHRLKKKNLQLKILRVSNIHQTYCAQLWTLNVWRYWNFCNFFFPTHQMNVSMVQFHLSSWCWLVVFVETICLIVFQFIYFMLETWELSTLRMESWVYSNWKSYSDFTFNRVLYLFQSIYKSI